MNLLKYKEMKRHNFVKIVLSALLLSFMASCTPDDDYPTPINPDNPINPITPEEQWGVYNPGKKIKKVYCSYENIYPEKELKEVWNWNENLLESIDHYNSNGTIEYREQYSYENNRIVRVETLGDHLYDKYTSYEYEGNTLIKAVTYRSNFVEDVVAFVYEDGKLSGCELVDSTKIDNREKGDTPKAIRLLWTGDNVESIVGIDNNDNEMWRIALLYDTKSNPLKGFLNSDCPVAMDDDDTYGFTYSKNNIVKAYLPRREEISYIYQYDNDGYPVEYIERPTGRCIFYEYE